MLEHLPDGQMGLQPAALGSDSDPCRLISWAWISHAASPRLSSLLWWGTVTAAVSGAPPLHLPQQLPFPLWLPLAGSRLLQAGSLAPLSLLTLPGAPSWQVGHKLALIPGS